MFSGIVRGVGVIERLESALGEAGGGMSDKMSSEAGGEAFGKTSDEAGGGTSGGAGDETARHMRIVIKAPRAIIGALKRGASIAVQGVCLTVTKLSRWRRTLEADIIPTTYRATTVGQWKVGGCVNLEPSLTVGEELGGHIVQGHVTGVATVVSIESASESRSRNPSGAGKNGGASGSGSRGGASKDAKATDTPGDTRITCMIADEQWSAIVPKGSIALNGVSLTVAECAKRRFTVGITPYTWAHTTLQYLHSGALVNIETDVFLRAATYIRTRQ